jgi:hypothetical protein
MRTSGLASPTRAELMTTSNRSTIAVVLQEHLLQVLRGVAQQSDLVARAQLSGQGYHVLVKAAPDLWPLLADAGDGPAGQLVQTRQHRLQPLPLRSAPEGELAPLGDLVQGREESAQRQAVLLLQAARLILIQAADDAAVVEEHCLDHGEALRTPGSGSLWVAAGRGRRRGG